MSGASNDCDAVTEQSTSLLSSPVQFTNWSRLGLNVKLVDIVGVAPGN